MPPMPTNFYPDGFPMDPIEAVKVCDFLTPKEKEEWNNWLVNATPEQKTELVDTLHSIFLEQKSSIAPATPQPQPAAPSFDTAATFAPAPSPFGTTQSVPINQPAPAQQPPQASVFNNPPPAQSFATQPNIAPNQRATSTAGQINPIQNPVQSPTNSPFPIESPSVPLDDPYKQSEAEFLKELESQKSKEINLADNSFFDDSKEDKLISQNDFFLGESNKANFDRNPLLDDIDDEVNNNAPTANDDIFFSPKNQDSKEGDFGADKNSSSQPKKPHDATTQVGSNKNNQSRPQQSPKKTPQIDDDYVKKAESMMLSAGEVSNLYKHFLDTQNKSATLEKEFQEKQAKLFNKIMEMVSEASIISDKVLKLNFQMVDNAKAIQDLKNATAVKGNVSLQYQINSLKDEMRRVERNLEYGIERVERDFNNFRDDISHRVDEINTQLAAALADTYKADGVLEALAKLQVKFDSKIESLEKKLAQNPQQGLAYNNSANQNKPSNYNQQSTKNPPDQSKTKTSQNQSKATQSQPEEKSSQQTSRQTAVDESKTPTSNIASLAGNSKPKDNTDFGSIFTSTFPNLSDFNDDYDFASGEGAKKVTVKTGEPQDVE